jgi:hypothetical protein
MRLLALLLLLPVSAAVQAIDLSASCNFTIVTTYRFASGTTDKGIINQSMVIRDNKTSAETSGADGSARATNSKVWSYVRDTTWLGDFGELLTINGWGKGFGTHSAVLQEVTPGYWASTYVGECTGDFGGDSP